MPRPYHYSLFDCCSPFGLCMKATCCTCVVAGRNHHRLQHGGDEGYNTCNGWCIGWCALTCCGVSWVLQMLDRSDMRDRYDMEGSGCGNCCTAFCCTCCEAIQTSKELEYVQVGQSAPVNGYIPQDKMAAVPQH